MLKTDAMVEFVLDGLMFDIEESYVLSNAGRPATLAWSELHTGVSYINFSEEAMEEISQADLIAKLDALGFQTTIKHNTEKNVFEGILKHTDKINFMMFVERFRAQHEGKDLSLEEIDAFNARVEAMPPGTTAA